MKTSHLKIQFYYDISIFSERNENFCEMILISERIFQIETKSGKIGQSACDSLYPLSFHIRYLTIKSIVGMLFKVFYCNL